MRALLVLAVVAATALAWLRNCPAPRADCAIPRFRDAAWAPPAPPLPGAPSPPRVAVIVLAREADAAALACTLRSFDGAYNGARRYPYVVMSEAAWSPAARAALAAETDAPVVFAVLPRGAWALPGGARGAAPPAADPPRYYGDTPAYRKMCRFYSGPVFLLPELARFDIFWRLDAHVRYVCDIAPADDPVAALAGGGVYAFGVTFREEMHTVPTLWATARAFAAARNASAALRAWGAGAWGRGCHFWSNMEVGALDFFRGDAYQAWFAAADAAGGFAHERWGDAPVRSLGLMMLAPRAAVRYLPELGYQHPPNVRCPRSGVCTQRGARVACAADAFAGCSNDIGDGLAHAEGCALDGMLADGAPGAWGAY